ncbi:hypothetical protein, partial [Bacteroides sp. 224]|uniref:hypothetical protein n=1 Tax=Bacteroides sp. 224 TaxID=2302936 RepID=UPI0019402807
RKKAITLNLMVWSDKLMQILKIQLLRLLSGCPVAQGGISSFHDFVFCIFASTPARFACI